jgi:hypothetical protein
MNAVAGASPWCPANGAEPGPSQPDRAGLAASLATQWHCDEPGWLPVLQPL